MGIKVLTIFGTRPEAIKMAPLIKEPEGRTSIESIICVTAQHREMLDQVLNIFEIKPDYDLDIMRESQSLVEVTTMVLTKLDQLIKQIKPDAILVHGDTTTSFVASLAAFYNQVFVGHVEAGLRTNNRYSPFPEEINRQMTGVIANVHFAPTKQAKLNLLNEGKDESTIFVTGNTVVDVLETTVSLDYKHQLFEENPSARVILVTAHRRENLGEGLLNIFKAIKKVVRNFKDVHIIYPLHLNPKIKELAIKMLAKEERVHLVDPLEITQFHNIMNKSYFIMTDSGGIQEEASSLGKPVLVLRDTTERPEGIEAGILKLVGTNTEDIYESCCELLSNEALYNQMSCLTDVYGNGQASKKIVNHLIHLLDDFK